MVLLQEESELQEIVQLVGPDALPDSQQVTLQTARMLREDFLQQNAFDDVDTYCPPAKQADMLRTILLFNKEAKTAVANGGDIKKIDALSVKDEIARMKYIPAKEFDVKIKDIKAKIVDQMAGV